MTDGHSQTQQHTKVNNVHVRCFTGDINAKTNRVSIAIKLRSQKKKNYVSLKC